MNKKELVLITGASAGIGFELAKIFAKNGHNLLLVARDKNRLEKINDIAKNFGVMSEFFVCDLSDHLQIKNLTEFAQKKHVSVLINNAGLGCPGKSFDQISQDEIRDIINTNLLAPIMLANFLYKHFLSQKNSAIININSIVSRETKKFRTIYSASKAGLKGFAESLALEAQEKGVAILNVYPTSVKTSPNQQNGMEADFVAQKIYQAFIEKKSELIIDGRKN